MSINRRFSTAPAIASNFRNSRGGSRKSNIARADLSSPVSFRYILKIATMKSSLIATSLFRVPFRVGDCKGDERRARICSWLDGHDHLIQGWIKGIDPFRSLRTALFSDISRIFLPYILAIFLFSAQLAARIVKESREMHGIYGAEILLDLLFSSSCIERLYGFINAIEHTVRAPKIRKINASFEIGRGHLLKSGHIKVINIVNDTIHMYI